MRGEASMMARWDGKDGVNERRCQGGLRMEAVKECVRLSVADAIACRLQPAPVGLAIVPHADW